MKKKNYSSMRKDVIFFENNKIARFYTLKKMTSLGYILFIIGISVAEYML